MLSWRARQYDEDGRLIRRVRDGRRRFLSPAEGGQRLDGAPDDLIEHHYKGGQRVRTTRTFWKTRDRGTIWTRTYSYDAGRVIGETVERHVFWSGGESDPEQIASLEHQYDEQGRKTRTIQKGSGPLPSHEMHFVYDDDGQLVRKKRLPLGGGPSELTWTFAYDGEGHLDSKEMHYPELDVPLYRVQYVRDADGRTTETRHLRRPETVKTYDYTCFEQEVDDD